jgi:hypothetical protein
LWTNDGAYRREGLSDVFEKLTGTKAVGMRSGADGENISGNDPSSKILLFSFLSLSLLIVVDVESDDGNG